VSAVLFEVDWTSPARRALARLPEKATAAAIELIYGLLERIPSALVTRCTSSWRGNHNAHLGDYRVVYRIDSEKRVVSILAINHRADVYRPR
jgi:mRNA interferase RelE/StbE